MTVLADSAGRMAASAAGAAGLAGALVLAFSAGPMSPGWWIGLGMCVVTFVALAALVWRLSGALASAQATAATRRQRAELLVGVMEALVQRIGMIPDAVASPAGADAIARADASAAVRVPEVAGDATVADLFERAEDGLRRRDEARAEVVDTAKLLAASAATSLLARAARIQGVTTELLNLPGASREVGERVLALGHMAAEAERHADSISVICGAFPVRTWKASASLPDVVRAASGRIAEWQRVIVAGDLPVRLQPRILEAVVHMVANLLDNANKFAPGDYATEVSFRRVYHGAAIVVEDGGQGIADPVTLERLNDIASGRTPITLANALPLGASPRTGLAVVGIYAQRYGLGVELGKSEYGGVRGTIMIPNTYLVDDDSVREPKPAPIPAASELSALANADSPQWPLEERPRAQPARHAAPIEAHAPGGGWQRAAEPDAHPLPQRRRKRVDQSAPAAAPLTRPRSAEEASTFMSRYVTGQKAAGSDARGAGGDHPAPTSKEMPRS